MATDAAQAYCAALDYLESSLGCDWTVTDWTDRSLGWRFYRLTHAPSVAQGWKIHVSAAPHESPAFLEMLADVLARLRIPFKVPRRIRDIVFLNSGDTGMTQLGKVLTLYPFDDQAACEAIAQLDRVWPASQGPEVQSDLHVRPGSAVSFRYGVFHAETEVIGSTGIHDFALVAGNGAVCADVRSTNGEQPPWAPLPPVPGYPPTAHWIRLDEPVWLGASEYIPLTVLGETPRARTFLAADVSTLDTVVIKAGRHGVASDTRGGSIRNLLRTEFAILRSLQAWPDTAPRALTWHDGDWPALVAEDFRGEPVSELPRCARIDCLPLLGDTLARVHEAGFVHGDIKLENAVRRHRGVGLIDFELAAPVGDPMRPCGTLGYLAPEAQDDTHDADASRDVFALAGCVVQAVLDFPPGLFPAGPGRMAAMLRNEEAADIANRIASWLAPVPERRPAARAAAATLHERVGDWRTITASAGSPSTDAELRWYRRASSDAARLAGSFMHPCDHGACWRNEHFMRPFDCEAINIGAAGIMLGLRSVDRALGRNDHYDAIDLGARWLSTRSAAGKAAGLFTGNAGVALALAVAGLHLSNGGYLMAARVRFEAAAADRRELDLFSGGAGVVWAACMLHELVAADWPIDAVRDVVSHLDKHATNASMVPVWGTGSDTTHFGCAHGSAGIAMALACWGRTCGDVASTDQARDTFRSLARHARTADGAALRIGPQESRHHAIGNWCHGVAGYLWALLVGLGDDPGLHDEVDWAVGVLADAMSVGTPTYCHGLAGQLELWHMLGAVPRFQSLARARSGKVARALRLMHLKVNESCTWTSDDRDIVTPDLWIGFLGPASALAMHSAGVCHPLLSSPWLADCARPPESAPGSGMRRRW